MARIDVVKAKIDLLKTVIGVVVFGSMVSLVLYNIQTPGEHFIVVLVAIVILFIFGLIVAKTLKGLFDELEEL
ncbi:MAG: hypothetical protein WC568_12415 [Candidatus Methanoperedens sp.]